LPPEVFSATVVIGPLPAAYIKEEHQLSEVAVNPLVVLETERTVRLARGGRLLPWLGPALRGLTGGRLRARACRLSVAEQISRWKNCAGCPHMHGCAYGEVYEPDPPAGLHLLAGWENAARPLVVSPAFPMPEDGRVGLTFPVTVAFIGPTAAGHAADFWECFRLGGADLAIGLGDDHVLFDVEPGPDRQFEVRLPLDPAECPGWAAWVRVELISPLFLQSSESEGRKRVVHQPTFGDLLRAGLRVFGPLHRLYAEALPEDVFARVKAAAEGVPTVEAHFRDFVQPKWSHRTKERFDLRGITGSAVYGPVPRWLVPWLEWAGRIHVGTHRVAGAGGWRVTAA
jgi:hypothetical protein